MEKQVLPETCGLCIQIHYIYRVQIYSDQEVSVGSNQDMREVLELCVGNEVQSRDRPQAAGATSWYQTVRQLASVSTLIQTQTCQIQLHN